MRWSVLAAVAACVVVVGAQPAAAKHPAPQVTDTIAVGDGPSGIASGAGAIWVANFLGDSLSRIDPQTLAVLTMFAEEGVAFVAADRDSVWIAAQTEDLAAEIDPATGEVAREPTQVGYPSGIAIGFGSVWVSQRTASPRPELGNSVARIDATSGEVLAPGIPVGSAPLGVAAGKQAIWVANELDGTVSRIDPDRGVVVATIPVGRRPADVAVGKTDVWVTNYADDTVTRIDARTNQVQGAPIPVGDGPFSVAVDKKTVWVANVFDRTVTRIDAHTGEVVGDPIVLPGAPQDLTISAGAVWVTGFQDGVVWRIAT